EFPSPRGPGSIPRVPRVAEGAGHPATERGQASVELLAGLPALIVAGLVAFQLLAVGYASSLAGDAAEAGAMAIAAGKPPAPAVRGALPGWARERVSLDTTGGSLTVRLRPPSPFAAIADRLEVSSSAWTRPGDGG